MTAAVRDNSPFVMQAATAKCAEQIAEFTETMADAVKAQSPVDSGNNRDSVDHSVNGLEGRVWSESGYGGFLNVGTARMAGRRYFEAAFEQTKQELANA